MESSEDRTKCLEANEIGSPTSCQFNTEFTLTKHGSVFPASGYIIYAPDPNSFFTTVHHNKIFI